LAVDEANHPNGGRLRDFASGLLDDDHLSKVAVHLEECAACRSRVDAMMADDTFLEKLQIASRSDQGILEDAVLLRQAARALRREVCQLSRREQNPPEDVSSPPREVGDYIILREIGRGGMGVVYQARHRTLQRLVALKMILAGGFASDTERQRFQREAELAARVQNPNIVQVYDVGIHQGHPFLAMEWVDRGTLADQVGTDPWPPDDSARLIEILARAIDAVHRWVSSTATSSRQTSCSILTPTAKRAVHWPEPFPRSRILAWPGQRTAGAG
jgi:eukaryotic-like serine/threonine-protein kinase